MNISASGLDYTQLNDKVRASKEDAVINDCLGQRFIAAGMGKRNITINGVPGNALGAYLDGACITVNGNAQDAAGDTMNDGKIIINGCAGDAVGYAMRGGEIYVKGDAGYRTGIHMKAYADKLPVIVIGGKCGSFLGEYQAGGLIIVLGLNITEPVVGYFCGTGMHGGKIILRGDISDARFPVQVRVCEAEKSDMDEIDGYLTNYAKYFNVRKSDILNEKFWVLTPNSQSPYKQLYVQN